MCEVSGTGAVDARKWLWRFAPQRLFELDELRSLDVVLPIRGAIDSRTEARRRVVARPETVLAQLARL